MDVGERSVNSDLASLQKSTRCVFSFYVECEKPAADRVINACDPLSVICGVRDCKEKLNRGRISMEAGTF